jgi:[histone H3]-lysine9 N-trimethyltransferase SUV39H
VTAHAEPRLSTPSDRVFINKTRKSLFRSPSWQNKKIFERNDRESPSPTPTNHKRNATSQFLSEGSIKNEAKPPPTPTTSQSRRNLTIRQGYAYTSGTSGEDILPAFVSGPKSGKPYRESSDEDDLIVVKPLKAESNVTRSFGKTKNTPRVENSHPTPSVVRKLNPAPNAPSLSKRNKAFTQADGTVRSRSSRSHFTDAHHSTTSTSPAARQDVSVSPKKTPSRPTIVVQIDSPRSQSATVVSSASRSLLDKFRQPLPRAGIHESRPVTLREAKQHKEAHLLAELKKDASIARTRASTVEEIFGSHGLSKHYDTASLQAQHKLFAQPKAKKVKRSKIKLDWGIPPTASTFDPADVIPPAEQAKCLLDTKFEDTSARAPLTFVNDLNDRRIDGKFQFVDSYVRREGFKLQPVPPDFGCQCTGQCDPSDTECGCFQTLDGKRVVPYVKRKDGLVVLNSQFIDSGGDTQQEIFECNDACHCSVDCFNRVVQKGRTIPLEIFMTRRCGFGIRSSQPIKKGQFIDVYLGELLTTKAIVDYENASTEKSSSYVFSLDFFGDASYHIQGLHFGSPTRFINHSCNPNSRTFTVMINHADKKIYKLAYFAIKDIPAMKEITFDYSPETAHEEPWIPTPGEEDEGVVRCLCGEKSCRGRVWPKRQTAKRRGRGWART